MFNIKERIFMEKEVKMMNEKNEVMNVKKEMVKEMKNVKKVVRKRVKEVEYEKVVSKKGAFKVVHQGDLILWAVRNNGDYLVYVVNEEKREIGLRLVRKMLHDEQVAKQEAAERKKTKEEKTDETAG